MSGVPSEEKQMFRFIKTTVLGGIVFLIPVIIFTFVIRKALEFTNKLATPLAKLLPVDSVGDLAITHLLAILILILICFLSGIAAKTTYARKLVKSLEANFLEKIPAYALAKAKAETMFSGEDSVGSKKPVMVRFDDSWQFAFEIDRVEDDKAVLFLPGSPDPWSGAVSIVALERITPLDITIKSVTGLMKHLGKGTNEALINSQAWDDRHSVR
jgi:uncharacterized membrane protein